MSFDEEPGGDLHGECALEIARLREERNVLLEACKAMVQRFGPCECYPDPAPPCAFCVTRTAINAAEKGGE